MNVNRLCRASSSRHGFSLVEAAIVLGVVGLVIGGIWVGAGALSESYKVNKTAEGILSTSKNVQNLISARDSEAIGHVVSITQTLIDAGAFPEDWVRGSVVETPLGNDMRVANAYIGLPGPRFSFYIDGVSRQHCIKLLVSLTAHPSSSISSQRLGVGWLYVNSHFTTTSFPITLAVAETACDSSANSLEFGFMYTRIN